MAIALEVRESMAINAEARIEVAEKEKGKIYRRGKTMYSPYFIRYFAWVIAQISSFRHHETATIHVDNFGVPLKLREVLPFLEDLMGEKFERTFGFKAALMDYQHLDAILVESLNNYELLHMEKPNGLESDIVLPPILVPNAEQARDWLHEQIGIMKAIAVKLKMDSFSGLTQAEDDADSTVSTIDISQQDGSQNLSKLSIRQLALIFIYEGIEIELPTARIVARIRGYDANSSGQQLMDDYKKFKGPANNRTGAERRALSAMCKDIATVIPYLSQDKRQKAEGELEILEDKK